MIARAPTRTAALCCLVLAGAFPAGAQSQDAMPEALRRLFDMVPAPRLSETLGMARPGVIAMDGDGLVRLRPTPLASASA